MDMNGVALFLGTALLASTSTIGSMKTVESAPRRVSSDCPFGFGSPGPVVSTATDESSRPSDTLLTPKHPKNMLKDYIDRSGRVIGLYEIYVHFPILREVWDNPVNKDSKFEPYLVSCFHGIELGFLLLSEFVKDKRQCLVKRPRIEVVCKDIVTQIQMLWELLDGQLDDVDFICQIPQVADDGNHCTASCGLNCIAETIRKGIDDFGDDDQLTLQTMVKSIINAYNAYLGSISVGIGFESQLNELASLVRLPIRVDFAKKEFMLDYANVVRPDVVLSTLTSEQYEHAEDFFFRTVHLGTECWAFNVIYRLTCARNFALQKQWHQAAVQIRYAATILNYLGDHVLLLTTMVVRDYLHLKVEIQGTSGEGSIAVKSFRSIVLALLDPLVRDLIGLDEAALLTKSTEVTLRQTLTYVYERPENYPGLSDYCKALECVESALLGGFYYKHFLLASDVIGLGAKGTMNRSVQALKNTFETVCFPVLDKIRADLGTKIDAELASNHAKIMSKILEKNPGLPPSPFVLTPSAPLQGDGIDAKLEAQMLEKLNAAEVSHLSLQSRYTPVFNTPIKTIKHSK